jgi:hypothetical protein
MPKKYVLKLTEDERGELEHVVNRYQFSYYTPGFFRD